MRGPLRCPGDEELLEDLVQELSALARAQAGVFVPLLVEAEHVAREVLERAIQVALDMADRIDRRRARRRPRRGTPGRSRRSRGTHLAARPANRPQPRRRRRAAPADAASRSASCTNTRAGAARSTCSHVEPARFDLLDERRRRDDRVVFEREGGDRDAARAPAEADRETAPVRPSADRSPFGHPSWPSSDAG